MDTSEKPEYLYKIVSKEQWQESQQRNEVVLGTIDADFIHLAKEEQVAPVVHKFWDGMEHIVLKIATDQLIGDLVYETNPGGSTRYYHLYAGCIPLDAVVDIQF